MDKKILVSMMVIGLVAALAGAGLYAYFNDTETSSGNTFTAGTLDLEVNGGGSVLPISVSNMKPGDADEVTIKVDNTGSIAGYLCMWIKDVTNSPGTTPEPEPTPDNGELGASIQITIWLDDGDNIWEEGEKVYIGPAWLNDLNNIKVVKNELLGAVSTAYIGFAWKIPTTVGNEIMDDSVTFTIEFALTQTTQP
jgi:predicted ribosomally synthesized peptide with SipW-like signal peptide